MQLSGRGAGLTVAVGMVVAAVLTVFLLAKPGATLTAATPAYGTNVGEPPAEISLTFTAPVVEAHVEVSGAVVGEASVDARTVTQPLDIRSPGQHVVTYHVVTQDGEAAGALPFTIGDPTGPRPPLPEPVPDPDVIATGHHGGEVDGVTKALLGLNAVVVLVLAVLLLRPRRGAAVTSTTTERSCHERSAP